MDSRTFGTALRTFVMFLLGRSAYVGTVMEEGISCSSCRSIFWLRALPCATQATAASRLA
jgi:hypothetical protein